MSNIIYQLIKKWPHHYENELVVLTKTTTHWYELFIGPDDFWFKKKRISEKYVRPSDSYFSVAAGSDLRKFVKDRNLI